MVYEDKAFDDKFGRFILIGTVHGAFSDCANDIPGIFVEVDDRSVLDFLHKETFGSGLSYMFFFSLLVSLMQDDNLYNSVPTVVEFHDVAGKIQ